MAELDTSGVVELPIPGPSDHHCYRWTDLSPFAQGTIQGMAAWCAENCVAASLRNFGFSDLAPEAIAMILRDCGDLKWVAMQQEPNMGAALWRCRQKSEVGQAFPRLRVYLNDDGKVALTSQASGEG